MSVESDGQRAGGGNSSGKQVIDNALIVWVRIVTTSLASVLTTRFAFSALGIEGYGAFLAIVAIPLGLSFISGAMQINSQRALAMTRSAGADRQRVFNALLGLHLLVACTILLFGGVLGTWLLANVLVIPAALAFSAALVLLLNVAAAAFGAFLAPYEALLQADERFGLFAVIEVVRAGLLLTVSVGLESMQGDRLLAFGAATALITATSALAGAFLAGRGHAEARMLPRLFVDVDIYRAQSRLFGWTLLGSFSVAARTQGMALVINIFFGAAGSAAFGIGNQLQSAFRQLSSAIASVIAPRVFRHEARGQRTAMLDATLGSCRLSSLVALGAIPLVMEMDTLLALWLVSPPPHASLVAVLLIVAYIVDQLSASLGHAHLAVGRIARYQIVAGSWTIAMVPLSYAAGRMDAGIGAILSLVALISGVVAWQRVSLLEPVAPGIVRSWAYTAVLPVARAATPVLIVSFWIVLALPSDSLRLLLTFLLSGGVLMATAFRFGLLPAERDALFTWMRRSA